MLSCESDAPSAEDELEPRAGSARDLELAHAGGRTDADPVLDSARAMIEAGRRTCRHDTFGDEAFWGGVLRIHDALKGSQRGGVSPETALRVELKVDSAALPRALMRKLRAGQVDPGAPATTLALLKRSASRSPRASASATWRKRPI